jgi:hypothetical protein
MVYLGIPVGDKKLGKGAFVGVTEKIFKMIPPWKEKLMSSGVRLIFSNSCLSSLTAYTMGFLFSSQRNSQKYGWHKIKVLLEGCNSDFKYHMINCQSICRLNDFGGLGLINSRILNEYLMTKWIWKLYQQKESLWGGG